MWCDSMVAFISRNASASGSARQPDANAFRLICLARCLAVFVIVLLNHSAEAREFQESAESTGAGEASASRRIAVIICGHPGDADHVELFQGSVENIRTGLAAHYEFAPVDIHVFHGDEVDADSDQESNDSSIEPSAIALAMPATKEIISAELQNLKTTITENDRLFVIVIGHTHFENGLAWLNLHGPDVQQKEFAAMFEGIAAKEQVFVITNPCSGYYIKPLSRPGRVIISATESDLEVNETLCPHALADMLSEAPLAEWDLDADKHLSLFEFYIVLCRGVADRYVDETLIATEHAQLDDNADGKGTELQLHYLTEDQGGLPKNRQRQQLTEGRDGVAASKLRLASY